MGKLSDKDRKKIIAYRVNGLTYKAIADKYHVSITTIRRTIDADPTTEKRLKQKKEKDTLDMLAFMDAQKADVQEFIKLGLETMKDPEKLRRTGIQSIATAIGIVLDKYIQLAKMAPRSEEALLDDGFMMALQASAAEDWKDGD